MESQDAADSFNLEMILQKAAARHSAVEEGERARLASLAHQREAEVDALTYSEGNIRGYAQSSEAVERRAIIKQSVKALRHIGATARMHIIAEEDAARNTLEEVEAFDRAAEATAFGSRIVALRNEEAAARVFASARSDLDRCENNVRVTISVAQLREWCVLRDLSDELLDDMASMATPRGTEGGVILLDEQTLYSLVIAESNIRYTVSAEWERDVTALEDYMETLLEEEENVAAAHQGARREASAVQATEENVERALDFKPTPPPPAPLATSGVAPPPPAYPRYCRSVKLCGGGVEPPPADDTVSPPVSVPRVSCPDWLQDDESSDRRNVDEEWTLGFRVLLEGLHCYMPYEYDWVLAGWRRVVRNDDDLFKRQAHLPRGFHSPQKRLFHERLGLLDRCIAGLPSTSPQRPSVAHRPTPPSNRQDVPSVPIPQRPEEQRATLDSLLQSLLFHEVTGRRLTEQDSEREIAALQQAYIDGLHRTHDWSRGWCATENMRVPPKPSSTKERHLPKVYRLGTDPKLPPSTSCRPPADKFLTPQRRQLPEGQCAANTAVLKLPVPRELLSRPQTSDGARRTLLEQH